MRCNRLGVYLAVVLAAVCATATASAADETGQSVVKLNATIRKPNYFRPWTKEAARKISGSGVVIEGKRILTNAHLVEHSSEVLVQLRGGGDQLSAKVLAIAPGIDLALVELTNPDWLKDVPALPLAEGLPEPKSHLSVYGYPTGGDELSITDGIVSRIEFSQYYYVAWGVRIQIDAALNPGNSGGPAVDNGKIVGLVFSKIDEAENIGFLIPSEEIRQFLSDVQDGTYTGNPQLFDVFQTAENEALRKYLKIPSDITGMIVTLPYRNEEEYPLKKWDLVTHVGSHGLDNQGYSDVRDELRMRFGYYVPLVAKNGTVDLTVFRDGQKKVVSVPVSPNRDMLIPGLENSKYPEYFIHGPIAFTAATQEYLQGLGDDWLTSLTFRESPLITRRFAKPSEPGEQLVVIATDPFPSSTVRGYDGQAASVIGRLNGEKVKNLRHLAELLSNSQEEYLRFEMADRTETLIFDRSELAADTERILENEGIRNRASESLRDVWEDK